MAIYVNQSASTLNTGLGGTGNITNLSCKNRVAERRELTAGPAPRGRRGSTGEHAYRAEFLFTPQEALVAQLLRDGHDELADGPGVWGVRYWITEEPRLPWRALNLPNSKGPGGRLSSRQSRCAMLSSRTRPDMRRILKRRRASPAHKQWVRP